MEILNLYDDLSITHVQEKASPVGASLRVAVTKTSAQGEAAQSATPNLMSFSTDENSIWFNGKKYGAYKLNYKLYELSGGSLNQSDIINALDGFTQEHWDLVSEGGIGYMVSPSESIASTTLCSLRAWVDSSYKYLSVVIYGVEGIMYLFFDYNKSSSTYEGTVVLDRSYIGRDEIVNNLTSTDTNNPLSAAMGKKLNDEKLAKTDVVNNLTTTDASKALSAAQGKALNDKISGLSSAYRVKGSKTNLSDVLALTDAKVGDVWSVTNAFTLGGKPYPANTNVVCITATSSSDHDENNWDPIGGTVDLSPYAKKTEVEESDNKIWEQLGVVVAKDEIVNNLTSSETNKPLSAAMGKKLQDEKLAKSDVVNSLSDSSTNKALSAAQGKVLNTKLSSNIIVIDTNSLPEDVTTEDQVINKALGVSGIELYNAFKSGATIVDNGDNIIYPSLVEPNHIIFNVLYLLDEPTVYTKIVELEFSSTGQYSSCTVTSKEYPIPVVENSLNSNNTANALSAAQGKALNDKISALGSVYRIKGTTNNIEDVFDISDSAQKGDVWNIIEAFTLNGKPYPAGTNVVCIQTWAEQSVDPHKNWDALGGTVDLSAYVPLSKVVDSLDSTSLYPLSANQGKQLKSLIDKIKTGIIIE